MKNKGLWATLGILGIVGGAVHVLQPLNINLLNIFGSIAMPLQFIVGLATIIYIVKMMRKK